MIQNKHLGQWAEWQAESHLRNLGYILIQKNYCSRFGEIDLIMSHHHQLIFIEVKARSKTAYGCAAEVISVSKRQKIIKTAYIFLMQYPQYESYYCRFDVICYDFMQRVTAKMSADFSQCCYRLNWIENAFTFDPELINL
ncbi:MULTISPECIES: YraN family protein [unclassified Acinetobacter]|uniref:YraN family protein n=1 Tax=unclassified Acinetobacter TaxID=196816 RepID=UPI0029350D11|nr:MULTISPECIES: YraN family protein [unclassified Acinetobacter]WOE31778.1 YraN family protein [Acinetobacter sp. SAAs470]WOE37245.1 YraN family protein [Acinetobacter sp. SAAs474]